MTSTTSREARHRGVIRLDEIVLSRIIDLPEGQRIIRLLLDPARLTIDVHIEGDGLPVCPPGAEPPVLNAAEYVAWPAILWAARGRELAEMVEVIAARLDRSADGDAGGYAQDLRRVLVGEYDPRREATA